MYCCRAPCFVVEKEATETLASYNAECNHDIGQRGGNDELFALGRLTLTRHLALLHIQA